MSGSPLHMVPSPATQRGQISSGADATRAGNGRGIRVSDAHLPLRAVRAEPTAPPAVLDRFEPRARSQSGSRDDDDSSMPPPDKKLMELRLLLKSLTKKSDEEIEEDLKRIGETGQAGNDDAAAAAAPQGAVADSTAVAVDIEVESSASVTVTASLSASGAEVQVADPIALDTDGDGSIGETGEKALFDLDADGRLDLVSNLDAPLLAIDRNGNGRIDDGSELFGDQRGSKNGFAELAKLDSNGDGKIDATDPDYMRLNLVNLRDPDALTNLGAGGIRSIWLDYLETGAEGHGTAAQISTYETTTGERRLAADMLIGYRGIDLVR